MRQKFIKLHNSLAIIAALVLLAWGGSALLHPIMAHFGPQQVVFFPPQAPIDLQGTTPVASILRAADIPAAQSIRLVPAAQGVLWQVTSHQDQQRRYFSPETGLEIAGGDRAQAIWLARYYLGQPETPVDTVDWVTEFSDTYPSVNRLLPVWRVRFAREDGLEALVYTETGSVAAVSNHWKNSAQNWFQRLHTWNFLSGKAETARVVLVTALVGTLWLMALSGVAMIIQIKRQKRASGARGWHRLAAYALALPLLMFATSGIWHLIANGWEQPARTLTLSPAVTVMDDDFGLHEQWATLSDGLPIQQVSLVETASGEKLYRLGLRVDPQTGPADAQDLRNARFDGVSPNGPAVYLDARTGLAWQPGDKELALQLGERFTGVSRTAIQSAEVVTRFGSDYDFRNKRLPVWKLDYGAPVNAVVFVDTATGVLADVAPHKTQAERLSFSILHKWNFLMMAGRTTQNITVSLLVLAMMGLMGGLGLKMALKARRRKN